MIICLQNDINRNEVQTLIIDIIARYSLYYMYYTFCSMRCLEMTEISNTVRLNKIRVMNGECDNPFIIFAFLLPSQLRNNIRCV